MGSGINYDLAYNISTLEEFGLDPISVQPGDVGFYGDFNGNRLRINIQSNGVEDSLTYYMSNVDSATISTVREVDTCGNSTSTENGTPVITANVVIEGKNINHTMQRCMH